MDIVDEDTENETKVARTTRSGKLFGVWQSRSRRRKLRQEAMDDPDMNVDDEDEQIEEDEEEVQSDDEEEESFEAGKSSCLCVMITGTNDRSGSLGCDYPISYSIVAR
jgi:hypothetical protein